MPTAIYYEGDRKPYLRATLTRGEEAIDIDGATLTFRLYRKGREAYEAPVVSEAATVVDGPNGVVEYQWAVDDLDASGNFSGVFIIDGEESVPDGGYIEIVVRGAA